MCLIVELSQAEALASERSFATTTGWIGIAALVIASIFAIGLAHTIIRPIRAMQTAAERYGEGDLTIRLPDNRTDELGLLAREFNVMAASLEEKENQLRLHSLNLEKQVEERTKEVQQSQMCFQALIENAPDGIALLGLDGKLHQVTPSTLQTLGYSIEDAQDQDPALLTHPDDLPVLLGILALVYAGNRFRWRRASSRWSTYGTPCDLIVPTAKPGPSKKLWNISVPWLAVTLTQKSLTTLCVS